LDITRSLKLSQPSLLLQESKPLKKHNDLNFFNTSGVQMNIEREPTEEELEEELEEFEEEEKEPEDDEDEDEYWSDDEDEDEE
jgi:hypothetical protein